MATGLSNGGGLAATGASLILGARGLVDGAGLSAGGGLGGGGGGLRLDFTTGALPATMSFTRNSVACYFNSAGVLTQAAVNEPRFVYDPVTLQSLGLLIEGSRVNSIRNSTCVGGAPGVAPTNWSVTGPASAVSRNVIGVGVEDGIEYMDIQYSGTPSASSSFSIAPEASTIMAALSGQVWTASMFVRIVGGSMTNLTGAIYVNERDVGGAPLVSSNTAIVPTTAALRTQRYIHARTLANASTAFVTTQCQFLYTISLPIDITLRIGLPQLEQLAVASSPIKTSTVAVTRGFDLANITDPRALTDKCYVARGRAANDVSLLSLQTMIHVDDGTNTNRNSTARVAAATRLATSFTNPGPATINMAAIADNADVAIAGRYEENNFAASTNGGAVVTDTAGVAAIGLTTARIGRAASGSSHPWNSTLRSVETRTTASDAELVTLSSLSAFPTLTDTELWMTAVTTNGGSVSMAEKAVVEAFVAAEKAAGTWALTVDYWPLWAENPIAALTSLKVRRLATIVAAPVHTPSRGFTFNGTSNYVSTGFVPNANGIGGSNLRMAIYQRDNVATATGLHGNGETASRGLNIRTRGSGNQIFGQANTTSVASLDTTITNSMGYTAVSRTSTPSNVLQLWKNGVAISTPVPGSFTGTGTGFALYIGAQKNSNGTPLNFVVCQIGFACAGFALTDTQEAAQYANVQAWATAIGAQV